MRKYATGWFIKGIFGAIIVVFIFWGVGTFRDADKVVAEVGPYKVTMTEYRNAYTRLYTFYRNLFRERFDENTLKELKVRERAMDELVDQCLLMMKAKELGITVTDREFTERIARMGDFQRDGRFDQKRYLDALRKNGLDPKEFEESQRRSMLGAKVASVVGDLGGDLTDQEAWERYVRIRGKVNLSYQVFDPADYRTKVNVTDKEISDAYEKEKDTYRSEPTYTLKVVVVEPKSGMKDDQVYLELLKAKDVAAYGKEKGLAVVDLGTMGESAMGRRFPTVKVDEAVKGLKKGEISLPVRVEGKAYIFQLVDKEDGKPLDKAAVTAQITEKLKTQKAGAMAKASAEEAIAQKSVKGAKETGFLPRNITIIPNVGNIPRDHAGLLTLSESKPLYDKPVEFSGKYYAFAFKAEKKPERADWEQEKATFKQSLLAQNREENLKAMLDEMKKKEKVKISWEDV